MNKTIVAVVSNPTAKIFDDHFEDVLDMIKLPIAQKKLESDKVIKYVK